MPKISNIATAEVQVAAPAAEVTGILGLYVL